MFEKWFRDYSLIFLFVLCFIFIKPFRAYVVLYCVAKFLVMLTEGFVAFIEDILKTLKNKYF